MTQEDKELEIWKPIPNYEEYEISTFGRVKRLAYDKPVCGGSFQHCNEHKHQHLQVFQELQFQTI